MSAVERELGERYGIDEFYYPGISIELDLPGGLKGEIENITKLLEQNSFKPSTDNIFRVMKTRKNLIDFFTETEDGKKYIEEYGVILKAEKPVGIAIPIEALLSYLAIGSLIYLAGKFLASFMDEAGKIAARKILDRKKTEKEITILIKISGSEYNFLKKLTTYFLSKDPSLLDSLNRLDKKSSQPNNYL